MGCLKERIQGDTNITDSHPMQNYLSTVYP
jgi:hypothetical protein